MGNIMTFHDLQKNIDDLLRTFRKETKEDAEIYFPTMEDDLIELLGILFEDDDDWIGYWVYELECGDKYEDGCVTSMSGGHEVNIPLKTVEDLWNLLISENN